jgi:nitrogen fixation protein FixH
MRQLRGQHVLAMMIAFFGVIFAVNGYFLFAALSTHTGIVAVEPYRKGLAYNQRIAADESQKELGWLTEIKGEATGRVTLSIRDSAGLAVTGHKATGILGRGATERFDQRLLFIERDAGTYVADAAPLASGFWLAQVEIRTANETEPRYRLRRRLWLSQ